MTKFGKSFASAKSRGRNKKLLLTLTPLAAGILTATHAPAQELEEVIVTATRRAESVLDVPYNISLFSADDLKKSGTTTLSDMTRLVPGLFSIDQGNAQRAGNNNFSLRGLNSQGALNNTDFPAFAPPHCFYLCGGNTGFFSINY